MTIKTLLGYLTTIVFAGLAVVAYLANDEAPMNPSPPESLPTDAAMMADETGDVSSDEPIEEEFDGEVIGIR